MKFNGIEHFDRFDDEIIYWVEISDVPLAIQNEARRLDGEAYNPSCFGLCVCYEGTTGNFEFVTDTDYSAGGRGNIYYVDNDGDRHWFKADLAPAFMEQVFCACDRINSGKDTIQGYQVKKSSYGAHFPTC